MLIGTVLAAVLMFVLEMGFSILAVAIPCKIFGWAFSWTAVFITYLFIEKLQDMLEILHDNFHTIVAQIAEELDEEDDEDGD